MTRQQKNFLLAVVALFLTGVAVKVYRTANPAEQGNATVTAANP